METESTAAAREKKQRRTFTVKFKQRAVERITKKGMAIEAAARKAGVVDSVIRRWVKNMEETANPDRRTSKKHKKPIAKKAKPPKPKKKQRANGLAKGPGPTQQAIIWLHHARDAAIVEVTRNPQRFDDPVYRAAMAALQILEGREA